MDNQLGVGKVVVHMGEFGCLHTCICDSGRLGWIETFLIRITNKKYIR